MVKTYYCGCCSDEFPILDCGFIDNVGFCFENCYDSILDGYSNDDESDYDYSSEDCYDYGW